MKHKMFLFLFVTFASILMGVLHTGQGSIHAQAAAEDSFGCQITSGRSTPSLPVKLVDNVIYLPVKIGNSYSFDFILDSGSGTASAIDESIARALGLSLGTKFRSGGAGEKQVDMFLVENFQYDLPGLKYSAKNGFTVPFAWMSPHWGRRLEGLVGGDLLSCAVTEIDYFGKTVRLFDPETYRYQGRGEAVPLELINGYAFVEAKVFLFGKKDPINARLMLDTGLRITSFNSPFVKDNGLVGQSPRTVEAMTGFGFGGESRGIIGRVRAIQVGSMSIKNPVVDFSQDAKGALASDAFSGIIGADILSRFDVVFDYARKQVFLEENAHFGRPFEFDMSGIRIISEGEDYRAHKVFRLIEDSPAEAAGLEEGDEIVKVDGRSASEFSQEEMKKLLMREGKNVALTIRRGGQLLDVAFQLKPFV